MFKSEFRFQFRPYQKRILEYFDHHLADNKLHVVAPPGSGKTILGLEALRRLNRPTLILAPTLTIRNQWLDRYLEFFLNKKRAPAWISLDITKPKFLNIITYQALLSESRKQSPTETIPEEELEGDSPGEPAGGTKTAGEKARAPGRVIQLLKGAGIEVLVLDEAHHLRKEWWNTLNRIEKEINPRIVALTATPPYDVSAQEWERYTSLCGPVDAEIYVPELVREKNLCPHQDYIWFSRPRKSENLALAEFRENVDRFVEGLRVDLELKSLLEAHPHITRPRENLEGILADPAAFSAKLIFLRTAGVTVEHLFKHLGVDGEKLPPLNHHWLEILLRDLLFVEAKALRKEQDKTRREVKTIRAALTALEKARKQREAAQRREGHSPEGEAAQEDERLALEKQREQTESLDAARLELERIEKANRVIARVGRDARRIGVVDYSRVRLNNPELVSRILSRSLSKIDGVEHIVELEANSLGREMRMVILTDYIRRGELPSRSGDETELSKMGVVPLFEKLRRGGRREPMAVLTGSLVIVPKSAVGALVRRARSLRLPANIISPKTLNFTDDFQRLEVTAGRRQKLVRLITDVFTEGEIRILIGTTALLGEGWDAPAMNSIVLASSVSTFMLSNQLRGRAIRSREGHPDKTANIWHLVCLEEKFEGPDYEALRKRFRGFMGPAFDQPRIESGLERLGIASNEIAFVDLINQTMREHAENRAGLRARWEQALEGDDLEHKLEFRLKASAKLPFRPFALFTSFAELLTKGAFLFSSIILIGGQLAARITVQDQFSGAIWILAGACLVGFAFTWRDFFRAARIFFRNGPMESSAREAAYALLESLRAAGRIQTPRSRIRIEMTRFMEEHIMVTAKGLSLEDQAVYFPALNEIFSPIKNPRYLLVRRGNLFGFRRRDYHAVPEVLAARKEDAEIFASHWRDHVGPMELHFTRNANGRRLLLEARLHNLSEEQDEGEQFNVWS